MPITKRVADRINTAMKTIRPIIEQQQARDVSEADTVTLVKDILNQALGYDKYSELTSEHQIRGTYCDIAIQQGERITAIVECKAIGITLDDKHVKQAVDYAANEGVEWVILTNAVIWRIYAVVFSKPIDKHLVAEINILDPNYTKSDDADHVYPLTKEAMAKGDLREDYERQLAFNRHMLAALLLHNDKVISHIRRELKRVSSINVSPEEITDLLRDEVIKRDALEGQHATDARNRVNAKENKPLRSTVSKKSEGPQANATDNDID